MIYYGNELYHHGIKGQKWGERNYQYEDGSLTPEGKKRYLKQTKADLKQLKKEQKAQRSKDLAKMSSAGRKRVELYNNGTKDEDLSEEYKSLLGSKSKKELDSYKKKEAQRYADLTMKEAEVKSLKGRRGEKKEFNHLVNKMGEYGNVGSEADIESGGKSTALYNSIKAKKGKKYADKVVAKMEDRKVSEIETSETSAALRNDVDSIVDSMDSFDYYYDYYDHY